MQPEFTQKPVTLIFYGVDGDKAKARAAAVREARGTAQIRHAVQFGGETEPCTSVVVLADVTSFDRDRIAKVYGDKVKVEGRRAAPPPPAGNVPPPPPPAH